MCDPTQQTEFARPVGSPLTADDVPNYSRRSAERMVAAARADADALVGQLQREVNAATDRLAAVEALVPPECFVHRSPDLRCTDLIGGRWANGAPWTADLCCLPCRLRLALSATNLPDSSGGDHDA